MARYVIILMLDDEGFFHVAVHVPIIQSSITSRYLFFGATIC